MTQFRSKPKIVDAFQWDGVMGDRVDAPDWLRDAIKNGDVVFRRVDEDTVQMRVQSIVFGKWHYADPGNWIVRQDFAPEFFRVMTDDEFRASYEPVE
jgi:hypothetical protein